MATGIAGILIGTGGVQAIAAPSAAPKTDLRADINRDGKVDVTGETDTSGEDSWTRLRGAVVLPNIDDDAKRCPTRSSTGKPLTDAQLAACHDAADTVLNGASDAADLARLRTVPAPGVSGQATGSVTIVGKGKARLFINRGGKWKHFAAADRLTAAELRSGVEFGIEATDVVRDAKLWDGRVQVRLSVTDGGTTVSDDVLLKTAPVLTHHHRQKAQEVLVTKLGKDVTYPELVAEQHKFVRDLEREVKAAGITKPVKKFTKYGDPWAQDFVEPGYVSMTGPGGRTQAMRVLIRSAQLDRSAGRELFERLRGKDVGVVQVAGALDSEEWTLNSMGNLETIPPYAHRGKEYPAGRIIMGHRPDYKSLPAKSMRTFLASQGMQSPLLLDTAWLGVGHVDEFVQFLPAKTARGWRIGIADPQGGLGLLKKAKAEGHGSKKMFSVPGKFGMPAPAETIEQVLASQAFQADNKLATERIEANLRLLKAETGITDAEVVRVPGLYYRGSLSGPAATGQKLQRLGGDYFGKFKMGQRGKQPFAQGKAAPAVWQNGAYVPGAVNGVVLSDSRYLSAKQWGPVIDGKDVFGTAVSSAYAKAGFTTVYIDDWYTYHAGSGEVHCGTNTLRDMSRAWWKRS
ncbi:protein-arginine deiminase domain-containing protein [Streptomyces albipurpureus]|uniref:Protein-arginine deiminase domain-containing protein n=1 Tax=Streptomyces albipurpureus TaxID=2897419 RepID=A0ABT0UL66_9ACTN|nr:protein-arginine deiminase domain-containing protein [Streptomyces sp. CWNU-1]MCM2388850.1 protein-arginine deiminase domain-containing protein [Streptomyces sp. CWNU-1]